jgi:hypothetical protein
MSACCWILNQILWCGITSFRPSKQNEGEKWSLFASWRLSRLHHHVSLQLALRVSATWYWVLRTSTSLYSEYFVLGVLCTRVLTYSECNKKWTHSSTSSPSGRAVIQSTTTIQYLVASSWHNLRREYLERLVLSCMSCILSYHNLVLFGVHIQGSLHWW